MPQTKCHVRILIAIFCCFQQGQNGGRAALQSHGTTLQELSCRVEQFDRIMHTLPPPPPSEERWAKA